MSTKKEEKATPSCSKRPQTDAFMRIVRQLRADPWNQVDVVHNIAAAQGLILKKASEAVSRSTGNSADETRAVNNF